MAAEVADAVVFQRSGGGASGSRPLVRSEGEGESLGAIQGKEAGKRRTGPEYKLAPLVELPLGSKKDLWELFVEGNEADDTPDQALKRKAAEAALSDVVISGSFGLDASAAPACEPPGKKAKTSSAPPASAAPASAAPANEPPAKTAKTSGEPPASAAPLQEGDLFKELPVPGSLTIGRRLGAGCFGEVFEGSLDSGGVVDKVAVKQDYGDPRELTLEAEFLFMEDFHKAVSQVSLQTHFVDPKHSIMVMQLASSTLFDWLHDAERHMRWGERTNLIQVKQMMLDVLGGLEVMHSRGYAHRDVKPDNLLFVCGETPDGMCRLAFGDFGLACSFGDHADPKLQNYRCDGTEGARAYLPPEIRAINHPQSRAPDAAARQDVWAAGILFAMLLDPFLMDEEFAAQIYLKPLDYISGIKQRRGDLENNPGKMMEHVLKRLLEPDPEMRCLAVDCYEMLLE